MHFNDTLKRYLFARHLLVSEGSEPQPNAAEALLSLSKLFGIRVLSGHTLATPDMVRIAGEELGMDVPQGFYRDFPRSVHALVPERAVCDQLLQYILSNFLGVLKQTGHPMLEQRFARLAFREDTEPKDFTIIPPEEAEAVLTRAVDDLLCSTRPLRQNQFELVLCFVQDFAYAPTHCACKDTAILLTLKTSDVRYADFITLPDVMKLEERLLWEFYGVEGTRRANLVNRDRRLIARVLDRKLAQGEPDIPGCCEKRKAWKGLLHAIHYRPRGERGRRFVKAMREGPNQSVYARFEPAMQAGDVRSAVDILYQGKGTGAVLRHATFLFSRCKTREDVLYVCDHLDTKNRIMLMQLILQYDYYNGNRRHNRVFRFMRNERAFTHRETDWERDHRKSWLAEEMIDELPFMLRGSLERYGRGGLGTVYVDPAMVRVPAPIQEAGASGGYGVLPRGSQFRLNPRKLTRAFVYWEKARDLDLSCTALTEGGLRVDKFNWQNMFSRQKGPVKYSGDQTSGEDGGVEYMDVDVQAVAGQFLDARYLVFEANVFRGADEYEMIDAEWRDPEFDLDAVFDGTELPKKKIRKELRCFDDFPCRTGFMQRDRITSGEVFEPLTVETNFRVTGAGSHVYLFAIDLRRHCVIWLNLLAGDDERVSNHSRAFLLPWLRLQGSVNLYDFFLCLGDALTDDPAGADVVVSDRDLPHREDAQLIHSWDAERQLALLNPVRKGIKASDDR